MGMVVADARDKDDDCYSVIVLSMHTRACTRTHTHTLACTHARTYTQTHTHTHRRTKEERTN